MLGIVSAWLKSLLLLNELELSDISAKMNHRLATSISLAG